MNFYVMCDTIGKQVSDYFKPNWILFEDYVKPFKEDLRPIWGLFWDCLKPNLRVFKRCLENIKPVKLSLTSESKYALSWCDLKDAPNSGRFEANDRAGPGMQNEENKSAQKQEKPKGQELGASWQA